MILERIGILRSMRKRRVGDDYDGAIAGGSGKGRADHPRDGFRARLSHGRFAAISGVKAKKRGFSQRRQERKEENFFWFFALSWRLCVSPEKRVLYFAILIITTPCEGTSAVY